MATFQRFMGLTHMLLLSSLFTLVFGANIKLDDNYLLHYFLYDNGKRIQFEVHAINVTGWVGIGVNEISPDLPGADIYIGGYDGTAGRPYGWDMHIPIDTIDKFPVKDTERNWDLADYLEQDSTTLLMIRRPLIFPDKANDTDITNKTIHLIWAYNEKYELPLEYGPTKWGSECVNLITDWVGCESVETTPWTTSGASSGTSIESSPSTDTEATSAKITTTVGITTEGNSMGVRMTSTAMYIMLVIITKCLL